MDSTAANAWMPPPLRRLAGRALERAFNRALKLDPDTQAALAKLDGRRIGVHLRGPEIAFDIAVREGALRVQPPQGEESQQGKTDLRVSATAASLLAMALSRNGETPPGKVEMAGDAELARRMEKLARDFAPDFEAAFADVFGEVVGVAIARALREASQWLRQNAQHAVQDSADWLRDESRLVVPRGELDDFLDGVDNLRERAERLNARVNRLREQTA
ncbi:MAG TPA: SCP2 sterol-binding domain-containing protein [Rhodanobacteraceae bacterium]|nr:SCP2 sterol-binding domain-containing protein [Rhodanobacteraceae bacterium]